MTSFRGTWLTCTRCPVRKKMQSSKIWSQICCIKRMTQYLDIVRPFSAIHFFFVLFCLSKLLIIYKIRIELIYCSKLVNIFCIYNNFLSKVGLSVNNLKCVRAHEMWFVSASHRRHHCLPALCVHFSSYKHTLDTLASRFCRIDRCTYFPGGRTFSCSVFFTTSLASERLFSSCFNLAVIVFKCALRLSFQCQGVHCLRISIRCSGGRLLKCFTSCCASSVAWHIFIALFNASSSSLNSFSQRLCHANSRCGLTRSGEVCLKALQLASTIPVLF